MKVNALSASGAVLSAYAAAGQIIVEAICRSKQRFYIRAIVRSAIRRNDFILVAARRFASMILRRLPWNTADNGAPRHRHRRFSESIPRGDHGERQRAMLPSVRLIAFA